MNDDDPGARLWRAATRIFIILLSTSHPNGIRHYIHNMHESERGARVPMNVRSIQLKQSFGQTQRAHLPKLRCNMSLIPNHQLQKHQQNSRENSKRAGEKTYHFH